MLRLDFHPSQKTRRWLIIGSVVFILIGVLVAWSPARAGLFGPLDETLANFLAKVLFTILSLLGKLLLVLIDIMLTVAKFNNFVRSYAVEKGWVAVRDLCNMLLIIVLLIIAWGTVMRIESYHYKRSLPKFILMAFLINFSKSIAGFFIDLSQVIMMTFVNAFKDAAAGNLTSGAGLQKILMFSEQIGDQKVEVGEVIGAIILGIILLAIMIGAVLMVTIILLGRILMLWILVVLSPLAYLGEAMDKMKSLASKWWKMFGQYLVVGPVLAFFLWLAMTVLSNPAHPGQAGEELASAGANNSLTTTEDSVNPLGISAAISDISSSKNLMNYIVAVALLFAASMAANELKTLGGNLAQSVRQGVSSRIAKAPFQGYNWLSRKASAGRLPKWLGGERLKGLPLNPVDVYQNIKRGMAGKRGEEDFLKQMYAEERLMKGGLTAPLLGAAAPSLVTTYFRGFAYSHGLKTLVHKGMLKKKDEDLREKEKGLSSADKATKDIEEAVAKNPALAFEYLNRQREIADKTGIKDINDPRIVAQVQKELAEKHGGDEYIAAVRRRDSASSQVNRLKKDIAHWEGYAPRDTLYQQMRRIKDEEERKKYPTNVADELIDSFNGAMARGDADAARGIFLQAAKVGHENELCNYGPAATTNYYHHRGDAARGIAGEGVMNENDMRAYIKKHELTKEQIEKQFDNKGNPFAEVGDHFEYSQRGLSAFVQEAFVRQLGQDKQTAFGLQSDVSKIAYETGHDGIIEGVGSRRGKFFQRATDDQQTRSKIEQSKMDFENHMRRSSRLSPCDEFLYDPKDPSKGRYSRFNQAGASMFVEKFPAISSLIGKERYNANAAAHLVRYNMDLLTGPLREMTERTLKSEAETRSTLERYLRSKEASPELKKEYLGSDGKIIDAKVPVFQKKYVDVKLEEYDNALIQLQHFAATQPEEGGVSTDEMEKIRQVGETLRAHDVKRSVT
ncbi:MAG: hypothetical protein PHI73_00265 [Patescibacteria group bacterium]|nr:hypothetical protein [Patescibacteria group bacterium]